MTGGGITVDSNLSAGGCVWQWTYRGVQYLEHTDYGRDMQSAFFITDNNGIFRNPDECGDSYSTSAISPQDRQGSPVATAYNDTVNLMQVTRAVPLEWYQDNFGGDASHPVVEQDLQLGKTLTFNYKNMGPVVKYDTYIYTPVEINLNQSNAFYIPTVYLLPQFNRYYTYDGGSNIVTEQTIACPSGGYRYNPPSGYGGVIISDQSASNAMGLFAIDVSKGGPADVMKLINFTCNPPTAQLSTLQAAFKRDIPIGWSSYSTWFISGTVTEIKQKMRLLYCQFNSDACGTTPQK